MTKKPAGWKWHDADFWAKGNDLLKCQHCGKQSAVSAPPSARHSPFCSRYEAGPVVRGPDLPPREPWPLSEMEREIDSYLTREPRPVEKRGKPEKSEAYKQWVRLGSCCNCGAPAPSDPHHEDTTIPILRRGVREKCRDTLCVSLCRECHDSLTGISGGYRLPRPDGGEHDRAESLAILHDAQVERLTLAVSLLPQEWRIEALSAGLAKVPEDVLRRALLTGGGDANERLAQALDSAGEDL